MNLLFWNETPWCADIVSYCEYFVSRWSWSLLVCFADLFPVLEKRMCDLRWEVRDSTLEFITQLTAALNGTTSIFISALTLFKSLWDYFRDHFHSYYCTSCLFLPDNSGFTEALHTSGMVSVLLSSLTDAEGYVRASAVAAVGEAVSASFHQTVLVSNSKLLVRQLLILHNSSSSNTIFRMVLHFSKVIIFMMDGPSLFCFKISPPFTAIKNLGRARTFF